MKKPELKDAETATKTVKDSLNHVMDFIFGKEDKRQGYTASVISRLSYIGTARGYVDSMVGPINDTDRRVHKQAEDKINEVILRVNNFYDTQWKDYQKTMESVSLSPFKNYEPLKR